ncbi:DUF6233 domain-containing protein [Streptomyces sp. NPDC002055]|uniref:DUF6233 domain-containing protein n=1 Tax=Streptomyces sp. NPDC002055 TaxID=3154534 RepID=UPI00331F2B9F
MQDDRYASAGPWARATLPDGQQLDVIVIGRTRTPDGHWWYELEAVLTARGTLGDGRTVAEPTPVAFSAPAASVTPIPGEDYTAVPTHGAVSGRQWQVENLWRTAAGPTRRLHRRDCWHARAAHQRVPTAEAYALLADPDVEPCDICHPERALRPV